MTDIYIPGILAVDQILAVVVHQVIGGADDLRIGHGAAAAEFHTPNQLGSVPVFLPDLGQQVIGDPAVFHHEPLAAFHQIQGCTQVIDAVIADVLAVDLHFLVGGGELHAVEIEGIVEGRLGRGGLQQLHIFHGKLAGAVFLRQLHKGHIGQHGQFFRHFCHLGRLQIPQIQLRHPVVILPAQDLHSAGKGDIAVGGPQLGDLLIGQLRHLQLHGLHLRQVDQIGHHGDEIIIPVFQHQFGGIRSEFLTAQGDLIQQIALRLLGLQQFQHRIVLAAGCIQGLQIREVFQDQAHILLCQTGDGKALGIIGILAPLERNVPQDLAVGKLGTERLIMAEGNILLPQIQALGADGISGSFHKNVIVAIPQEAHSTANQQHQNNQYHNQHGNQLTFHSY